MATNPRQAQPGKRARLVKQVKREERTCHLCGQYVNVKMPARLPASPEVDELVPVSWGGDPLSRANVRLAHRWCNNTRSTHAYAIWRERLTADPPRFAADGTLIREGGQRPARPQVPVVSRRW